MNFNRFVISSGNTTSVEPIYRNEKPASPLAITISPDIPLMGDMGIRDELKGGTGVGWCELVGYCACDKVHVSTRTHEGSIILGVYIGVHHSGKGVHIGVYKP